MLALILCAMLFYSGDIACGPPAPSSTFPPNVVSFLTRLGLLSPSLLSPTTILRSHVRHDQLEAVLQCSHVRILVVPELEALRNDLHRPMGRRSSVTCLEAQIKVAGI